MAKVTAYLSARVDARGKSEILLRFVGGRDHIYRLHSHLSVAPSRWKEGAVVIPRLETDEQRELKALRSRLDGLTAHLLDTFEALHPEDRTKERMQEAVEQYHHPERTDRRDLLELFREFRASRDISPNRDKRYGVTLRSLERFQAFRGRALTIEGMDARALQEYRDFITNEYVIARKRRWRTLYATEERPPEPRSHNTVVDFLKVVRAFFNWLSRQGLTASDPFRTFEIGTAAYGTPYFITNEERERLYRTNLGRHPALAAQRDIFVFQCLTGCRVGDLIRLRKEDVVDGVLVYIPAKTMKDHPRTVRVPLSTTARRIVDSYADLPGPKLLPFISAPKYNEAIKRMFLAARLTRPVSILDPVTQKEVKRPLNEVASSHLARRTFVGNLYRVVKDPDIVGAMSAHEQGSKAFARYRTIDDSIKTDIVELLEAKK